MCGITGIFSLDQECVSPVLLRNMTDVVQHRGPDGEGFWIQDGIGLGHRRLAILDLSNQASQPMMTEDGKFILVYNGEIYNFQELKVELKSLGHRFQSRSDAEVALYAYAEWGAKSLEKFNGMFAMAVWDREKQTLFLARDRYGIKPLYYYQDEKIFLFASEIKSLLQHPRVRKGVNPEALLEYFTFQNIFTNQTLFKGIKLFPPGHYGTIKQKEKNISLRRYWDYTFQESSDVRDEREYEEELERLFVQAVRRQLVSDVPVGAYLSGGMDSGAVTAVASQQIPYLSSFTCGFDLSSATETEMGFDERRRAEALSYQYQTALYEVVLKAGDMERVFQNLIWHLEDLRVGQCYPNYYISQLAGKFVKVVLAGTGGDELFAGYPWRYYRAVKNQSFDEYIEKYYTYWQRLVPDKIIPSLFQPEVWREMADINTLDIFRQVMENHENEIKTPEEYVNHSLYFESKTFLHGLFIVEDKLSMAHGLEARVPFLDNDLVNFAMRLPVNLKLRELKNLIQMDENQPGPKHEIYFKKTSDGKLILRKVLGRYMPSEYVNGVKQGFSAPDASWFRKESLEYIRNILFNKHASIYDYLRPEVVKSLVNEHLNGEKNRRLFIWSLLSFEWWLRNFVN